jgi:putative ABC transport system permease protein
MMDTVETTLRPPRLAARLLNRLLDAWVRDQAMGDLEERFRVEAGQHGLLWARAWYRIQVWPVLKSFVENNLLWGSAMFKNYLKTAWRSIKRQKGYSVINIAGLALGMACAILIVFYIHHELSYDRFHENAGRIYRVVVDATFRQNWTPQPRRRLRPLAGISLKSLPPSGSTRKTLVKC